MTRDGYDPPVGYITEQSLPNLLRGVDCDVESLAGHHRLDGVSPQLVQFGRQELRRPVPGVHESVATLRTLHHLGIAVLHGRHSCYSAAPSRSHLADEVTLGTLIDRRSVGRVQTDRALQCLHQLLYPARPVALRLALLTQVYWRKSPRGTRTVLNTAL